MKRIVEIALLVPGMLALSGDALWAAVDAKASYQIIVDRNPFGLRPLPPPVSAAGPPEPPPKPPASFKLVGITSIQSPKKALILKTETTPNTKPKYFRIEEGGRDGDIDVLEIDAKNGSVKIAYAGNNSVLKFEKENVKAAGTPGGPAMPNYAAAPGMGLPPPPAMSTTMPGGAPYQPNAGAAALGGRFNTGLSPGNPNNGAYNPSGNIPPPGGTPSGAAPQFNFQLNTPGSGEPVRTVPTRQLRINPGGTPQSSSPPTPAPVDPDVQAVLIELNRQATAADVNKGNLPPLPPTELTPPSP
ncbi:hypothetical protein LBMAG56_12640 [Verrucomicrobiota bacterium]|nr:hypothetical protein LBMAG56_12640 [Verrucomicrobiota bacterium]